MSRLQDAVRFDLSALRDVPFQILTELEPQHSRVVLLMERLARDVIRAIAANQSELRQVEWRTLEHVLATALESLGFDTELTPSTKDGGKDIVLTCLEHGTRRSYAVEIKHWVAGKKVGGNHLKKFLDVLVTERHDRGLFLSTSGYASDAGGQLQHLEHRRLRVAGSDKMVALCRMFVLGESGLWIADRTPTEILFEGTFEPGSIQMPRTGLGRRR